MTTEQQIPKLLGVLVEHQRKFSVLSTEDAQAAITKPEKFIELAVRAWQARGSSADISVAPLISDWVKFCKEHLGLDVSMEGIAIPEPQKGYIDIFMPKGFSYGLAFETMKKLFPVSQSVEEQIKQIDPEKEERNPKNGSYFVRFKLVREADKRLANISANEIVRKGMKTITLLERMWFEIVYFILFGKHLDNNNWTLCSGSRYRGGDVPEACWGPLDGGFCVSWGDPDGAVPGSRARQAVSYS